MIAVIDQYYEHGVKLIPFTVENKLLCENAAKEVGTRCNSDGIAVPNTDKLDELLKDVPVIKFGKVVECKAVFVHVSEW